MVAYCTSFSSSALLSWLLLNYISQRFRGILLRISAALFVAGCCLLRTLGLNSHAAHWISYQSLTGTSAGVGFSVMSKFLLRVSSIRDRYSICEHLESPRTAFRSRLTEPLGATPFLFLILGGALSVSIAQNIFLHQINSQVRGSTLNATITLTGSTNSTTSTNSSGIQLPKGELDEMSIFGQGIQKLFILPIAAACLFLISCLLVSSIASLW
jgi:Na+-translocating ferredoxin:NAD+ oxidoreductase RnfA subunit